MKKLFLLRHAKSSWDNPELADFDRPLANRGQKAMPKLAREMRKRGVRPDLVLCSAAKRAQQTWQLAKDGLKVDPQVKVLRGLYLSGAARLLAQIRRTPDSVQTVLMVGHNPGMERLAALLAGPGSDNAASARMAEKFPTAALACFSIEVTHWADVGERGAVLTDFIRPRDLS